MNEMPASGNLPTLSGVWDALSKPPDGLSGGVRGKDIGRKTRPELDGGGGV